MQTENFKEKYPILFTKVAKNKTLDEMVEYFKTKIENHPIAGLIAVFDHFEHTKKLEDGVIAEDILGVKNVIFCFGKEIPNAKMPMIRPRSIAITEYNEYFSVGFMEAPNEVMNQLIVEWVKEL